MNAASSAASRGGRVGAPAIDPLSCSERGGFGARGGRVGATRAIDTAPWPERGAFPVGHAPRRRYRLAPLPFAAAPLGREVKHGRVGPLWRVVYQAREGGERDTGGASVTGCERTPETIGESAPHVGAERRGWRGGRGCRGRPAGVVGPNRGPTIGRVMRKCLFRRRDSNPD